MWCSFKNSTQVSQLLIQSLTHLYNGNYLEQPQGTPTAIGGTEYKG